MNVADANENLVPCPCCGEGLVEANHEFDIYDDYQFNHPDYCGGANRMSYRERKNVSA